MKNAVKQLSRSIVQLASGEIPARLCGIATIILLARTSGVAMVGVYALAQSMVQYAYPFIDFGLRHVGARLVAKHPEADRQIVVEVQKRRLVMGALIVPFLFVYALIANISLEFKIFLFLFSAISCLYATSLEWVAWGKENLRLVGLAKIIITGSVLLALLIGEARGSILSWLVIGNAVGYILQGVIFWLWWRHASGTQADPELSDTVREALAWRKTSIMGLAWFCNLAFNTIDVVMLGVMSNAHEVGLYSAAYRIMNQVLFTYYLLTQVLYPRLARQKVEQRIRALRPEILVSLCAFGIVIASLLSLSRHVVVRFVFGQRFLGATLLLLLLAWAIPLDFLTSYISNAYIAWGMETKVLLCTGLAAGTNVALNLFWIPRHGATAAAVNTIISYIVFLCGLALAGRLAPGELTLPKSETADDLLHGETG